MSGEGSILKVRILTRFKLFGLEQAFEEEVGVDGDLVATMLSDGLSCRARDNNIRCRYNGNPAAL